MLSRALAAFKADLAARGIEQNVVTMVFSEFGRRIRVQRLGRHRSRRRRPDAGQRLRRAGRAGRRASGRATSTTATATCVVKTDFRTVYQSLISEWLGGDPAAILPGGPFPGIQRYDGGTSLMK